MGGRYPNHDLLTNDPQVPKNKELHVPGYTGTSAQRVACVTMVRSDFWFETDTNLLYQYNGTAWQSIAVSAGAVVSVSATSPISSTGGSTPVISWINIRSEIWLNGGNGSGATNTMIRRFTTVVKNAGTDISITQDATNGDSFTINTDGLYAITYLDKDGTGGVAWGISVNSNQLTTAITAITASNVLAVTWGPSAAAPDTCTIIYKATAGDVIRAHSGTASRPDGTIAQTTSIRIVKIGP